MSYPAGIQGYYSTDLIGDYGAYSRRSPQSLRGPVSLPHYLSLAVVLLGLMSYLFSYFFKVHDGDVGWAVRFALLAGLVAAFGAAPRQTPSDTVVATLAAIGFLDGLWSVITAPNAPERQLGWALTAIVVFNGLQAVAAIAALLLQTGVDRGAARSEYDAYADYYAQAARYYGQYPDQYGQVHPDAASPGGVAQAHQQAAAPQSQQAAATQAGSYAEYVGRYEGEHPPASGQVSASAGQQPAPAGPRQDPQQGPQQGTQQGLPSFGQAQAPAQQRGGDTEHRSPFPP